MSDSIVDKSKSPMPVTITSPVWADEDGSTVQDDCPPLEVSAADYNQQSCIPIQPEVISMPSPLVSIPTKDEIYKALLTTGLIRDCGIDLRQAIAKSTNKYERAIYQAMYDNPRGCECQKAADSNRVCMFKATECQHALLVAIVNAMTDGNPTRERIDAIDVGHFISVCKQVDYIHRIHWHGVYPMYLNSYLHMQKYNHKCADNCIIHSMAFDKSQEVDGARKTMGAQFNVFVAQHMTMYKHFRGHGGVRRQKPAGDHTSAPVKRNHDAPKNSAAASNAASQNAASNAASQNAASSSGSTLNIKRNGKPKRASTDRPISIAEALGEAGNK